MLQTAVCEVSVDTAYVLQGDSGGPLVRKPKWRWIQAGVVPWDKQSHHSQPARLHRFSSSGTDRESERHLPALPSNYTPSKPPNTIDIAACVAMAPKNSRMVGGQAAPDGAWPWQVVSTEEEVTPVEGSSSKQWVLRRARNCHRVGASKPRGPQPQRSEVAHHSVHSTTVTTTRPPKDTTCHCQAVLLRHFTAYIKPVCLAGLRQCPPQWHRHLDHRLGGHPISGFLCAATETDARWGMPINGIDSAFCNKLNHPYPPEPNMRVRD
uniref:Peptidase S1 domain-containing protein n=1 Tax=Knipowitschia caucasica TaxID=637954 RepID=A0AAV2JXM4_KNICA